MAGKNQVIAFYFAISMSGHIKWSNPVYCRLRLSSHVILHFAEKQKEGYGVPPFVFIKNNPLLDQELFCQFKAGARQLNIINTRLQCGW